VDAITRTRNGAAAMVEPPCPARDTELPATAEERALWHREQERLERAWLDTFARTQRLAMAA
jgi:hypothetical protein